MGRDKPTHYDKAPIQAHPVETVARPSSSLLRGSKRNDPGAVLGDFLAVAALRSR
jgi:hypothetical protein